MIPEEVTIVTVIPAIIMNKHIRFTGKLSQNIAIVAIVIIVTIVAVRIGIITVIVVSPTVVIPSVIFPTSVPVVLIVVVISCIIVVRVVVIVHRGRSVILRPGSVTATVIGIGHITFIAFIQIILFFSV